MFDISFVAYLKVMPEEKETFLQKQFDSNIPCFVVRYDTQLVGFVWLSPHQVNQSPDSYAATNLFVAKKFRGQGLAKLLLMTAVNTVFSETDVPKIVSTVYETNTASLQTHLKAGFVIAGMNKVQHLGRMSNEKFVPLKNNSREVQ
ncbi:hypothetical protein FACS18942_06230 [Planctomycetales bacterium]|nr:hypothetical protein FACS18942_06230 [Planctomycetales bacterium]